MSVARAGSAQPTSTPRHLPTLVIVGPTACGKTALALELARRHRGLEVLCADSMTVYRGMDIGTAKPTAAERAQVPHHLLDLVEPSQRFTVVDYADAYRSAVAALAARGADAVLVGGTGLYLRTVLDGLTPPPEYPDLAVGLHALAERPESGAPALHGWLAELDPLAASRIEPSNLRRIVRALSVCLGSGRRFSDWGPGLGIYPELACRIVGIDIDRDALDARIAERYRRQLADGLLEEIRCLRNGMLSPTAAQALGYKEFAAHLDGDCTFDEAFDEAVARTRRFARRQQRWFARDPRIEWLRFGPADELADRIGPLSALPATDPPSLGASADRR